MQRRRRIRQQQLQPAVVYPLGSHPDSERKNCSRCIAGYCAPVTGSAPASAVSVLFRSRGASSPARYSRNPRRCATRVKRSSNRVAFLQRTRSRRTRYRLRHQHTPQHPTTLPPGRKANRLL